MSTFVSCIESKLIVREGEKAEKLEEIGALIGGNVTFEDAEEDFSLGCGLVAVNPYVGCEAWPSGYFWGDDVLRDVLMRCEPGSSVEYFDDDGFLFVIHVRNAAGVAAECDEPVPRWRRRL